MSVKIIHTEPQPLTQGELRVLKIKRNKRFYFLLSAWFVIMAIISYELGFRYWAAKQGIQTRVGYRGARLEPELVLKVVPPFFLFLLIVISYFIINDFLKSAYKVHKDIAGGSKNVISFIPSKVPMPFFRRYFLNTPFDKKPQLEISEADFYKLQDDSYVVAEVAPSSQYIFCLRINNEVVEFS